MKWAARAVLLTLIAAAAYGLCVAPMTTNGALWPIPTKHTHVMWFILVALGYMAVAGVVLLTLIATVVWCVRTGWPKEANGA